jgi:hypothetical protein
MRGHCSFVFMGKTESKNLVTVQAKQPEPVEGCDFSLNAHFGKFSVLHSYKT